MNDEVIRAVAQNKLFPCYGCKERTCGCHSKCEAYLKAVEINEAVKQHRKVDETTDYYQQKKKKMRLYIKKK